ncbi:SDR family oxidoreductase [Endozoicomonadaceae bacterium StTr2]
MTEHNEIRVVIAGCGDVGCELARILLADKVKVWGLRRNTEALPAGVVPIKADLSSPHKPTDWPDKIDYLVYCAAANGHSPEAYQQAYVTGLQHVLDWTAEGTQQPKRMFFTSSTGVYHQSGGEWVDETSPTQPEGFSGTIMLEAENVLQQNPIPSTAVRFGGIYGPGRQRMMRQALAGKGYADTPVSWSNRIHRDDCAGVLRHLIQQDMAGNSLDGCYIGVDDCPAPLHEVMQWLTRQLNTEITERQQSSRGSKRCQNNLLKQTGYQFRYRDYKAGYAALLASSGNSGVCE